MSNLKDTFQHPLIVCKHHINISNFNNFANELSKRLEINIEMLDSPSVNSYLKTITTEVENQKGILKKRKSILIPAIKYELSFDEIVYVFYNDFIEIKIDLTLDFFHFFALHKNNELKQIKLFKTLFKQLQQLGINEVYSAIFDEITISENSKYSWEDILGAIDSSKNNFILEI